MQDGDDDATVSPALIAVHGALGGASPLTDARRVVAALSTLPDAALMAVADQYDDPEAVIQIWRETCKEMLR